MKIVNVERESIPIMNIVAAVTNFTVLPEVRAAEANRKVHRNIPGSAGRCTLHVLRALLAWQIYQNKVLYISGLWV